MELVSLLKIKMRRIVFIFSFIAIVITIFQACQKDKFQSIAYNFETPANFPPMPEPADNPLTKPGVDLGRMLFYDPILSSDSTISCASCHGIENSFADNKRFSVGVDGAIGDINAMAIINLAWQTRFFWNGRENSLEAQALGPINNPIEMHETSENVVRKLTRHPLYQLRFQNAFPNQVITKELVGKAIAQFERIIVSNNSTYDQFYKIQERAFTVDEYLGFQIFFTERGQCFHCHGANGTLLAHNLDTVFRNNGMLTDAEITGKGLSFVTHKSTDDGKFKVPTLRNIELTGPYMHDGRFSSLEQVVEFYSSGIKENRNLDINFSKSPERLEQFGGLGFTSDEKKHLVSFLKTLTDTSFIHNPLYQNPFTH